MKRTILLLGLTFFLQTACNKSNNDTPESHVHWNVSKVEGPTSGLVNETISLTVYCPASSGCDYISKFESDKNGNTISIKAFGGTTKDSFCTQAAVPIQTTYEFTSNATGQFVLQFINPDNSILKHYLTIQ